METSLQALLPKPSQTSPIYTSRLVLRPFSSADLPGLFNLRTKPQVMQWTSQKRIDHSLQETVEWMNRFISTDDESPRQNFNFIVALQAQNSDENQDTADPAQQVIGVCGLTSLTSPPNSQYPNFGYMFLPETWGKGYATEAIVGFQTLWLRLLKEYRALNRCVVDVVGTLRAVTLETNQASARVLQKSGWKVDEVADDEGARVVRWLWRGELSVAT